MDHFSITPSHIIQYLYCPRFTFYEHVLKIPQYEDRKYKVGRGRNVHEQKSRQNIEYLRKRIGVTDKYINQYLTNNLLRGEVDEVLKLDDDSMAPLDYKFAQYKNKVFNTYKTQLYSYAWLIESNFDCKVRKGFLIYTRSKNKLVDVNISRNAIEKVKECAEEICQIIQENDYPKATKYKKRCVNCTYRNICTK